LGEEKGLDSVTIDDVTMNESNEDNIVGTTEPKPGEWSRDRDASGDKGTKWEVREVCGSEKVGIEKVVNVGSFEVSANVNIEWFEMETRSDSKKENWCS